MTHPARAVTPPFRPAGAARGRPAPSEAADPAAWVALREEARRVAAERGSDADRLRIAQSFVTLVVEAYWAEVAPDLPVARHPGGVTRSLPRAAERRLAERLAGTAAAGDPAVAGYAVGATYTVMLPDRYRSAFGVFYTPPAVVERLLDRAEAAGVDWRSCRVLDPACGGGAFLAPVARRMLAALGDRPAGAVLDHVERHVAGFEIDPIGAWMSRVFLDVVLAPASRAAGGRRAEPPITVCDSLALDDPAIAEGGGYDLVIGNPPYGRITLDPEARRRWARGLYGHANIYGLFTDLAVRLARPGGIIAYVTPTGFLGGEYFKNLRRLLGEEAPPVSIDFVDARKGVFADVLQETLLAVYRKKDA